MIMKIEFSKNILGFEGIRKLQAMKLDPELKTNRSSKKDVLIPFSEILLRN
jgi:flagellar assembly factor FliW